VTCAMKKTILVDCVIEVDVNVPEWYSQEKAKWLYEEVKKSILRYVDNVSGVHVITHTRNVCGFCGIEWEDDPACCQRAMDEWKDNRGGE